MPTPEDVIPTTLRVRNEGAAAVTIQADTGSASETIDPNSDKPLELALLRSRSFAQLMAEGKIKLVEITSPTKEQYLLARQILPRLLRHLGGDFAELHQRMQSEIVGLEKKRRSYNRHWDKAEGAIEQAEAAKDAAHHLYRGVHHFLKTKPEQDAVDAVMAQLATLQAEDLSETGKLFEQWLEEFETKTAELELAERRLAAAEQAYVTVFASRKRALKKASDDFATADHETDIGSRIEPFP